MSLLPDTAIRPPVGEPILSGMTQSLDNPIVEIRSNYPFRVHNAHVRNSFRRGIAAGALA
jgi:hypothetical protein